MIHSFVTRFGKSVCVNVLQIKKRYYDLVDSEVLMLIKNGRFTEAKACVEEMTGIQ
jgi:hypothetical protein